MIRQNWRAAVATSLCALLILWAAHAGDAPADAGKAEDFKGKTFDMKEKTDVAILLSCPAGKEITATTNGTKETDVHLFVYGADKKELGKDTSPGPKCEVKFTPAKDGKCKLLVRNLGPGANKVTLEVKVAK